MLIEEKITRLTPAGELEIDLRPVHDVCLLYTPWETGLHTYRLKGSTWVGEPNWDLGIPLVTQAERAEAETPLRRFVDGIPTGLRTLAARFIHNQVLLLGWAARYQGARDLLQNNPVLLWLMVGAAQKLDWSENRVKALLRQKQHEILQQVSGAGTKTAVRYLRKLVLKRGDKREFRLVLWSIRQEGLMACLRQLSSVSIHVVAVLHRCPAFATDAMVRSLASSLSDDLDIPAALSQAALIQQVRDDTVRLGNTLEIQNTEQVVRRCSSFEQLNRLHDRWTRSLNSRKVDSIVSVGFPSPPLEGSKTIRPIRNSGALREEGRIMAHCVGSYSDKVLSGRSYIYKVFEPERATLELKIQGGQIAIGEFRLKNDDIPSEYTHKAVDEWLESRLSPKGGE